MPCLRNLSKELLLNVLEFSSDTSVLEFAATSQGVRSAVDECRSTGKGFPWRQPPGSLEVSGLWRVFGLGDLKRIPVPAVNLRCDVEFQDFAEVVAFLKAANDFAADTMDGHVTFDKLSFDAGDVAHLFFGADDQNDRWCATGETVVLFNGRRVECTLDAQRTDDDENPWMYGRPRGRRELATKSHHLLQQPSVTRAQNACQYTVWWYSRSWRGVSFHRLRAHKHATATVFWCQQRAWCSGVLDVWLGSQKPISKVGWYAQACRCQCFSVLEGLTRRTRA